MTSALVQKLSECKELRRILETTVTELGRSLNSNCCEILLANPLDPNSALICEAYDQQSFIKTDSQTDMARLTLPLVLNGRSFGSLILIRSTSWSTEEVDSTNLLIAKLSELIRQAQINDIVQRETFRSNFLAEISNLMAYSLGIGDALFMVVNILGKALRASRCLFVCTDDKTSNWKCYEFWQQDKVKSCQEYHWPTNDSSLIAQTLSARSPLKFYEGQENSYLTPAQAELQFSGTRSLLALPLNHDNIVYGCVIIQQCDYRRDWTRDEVDMVQHAADRVAQALANLPEEKRIHKPIMQLHQRIVAPQQASSAAPTGAALVQSLKGAFGQKSIPSAIETLHELPAQESLPLQLSGKTVPVSNFSQAPTIKPAKRSTTGNKLPQLKKKSELKDVEPTSPVAAPNIVPVKAKGKGEKATTPTPTFPQPVVQPASQPVWGNLDEIPTPATGPAMSGLGASMLPRLKAQSAASDSPLRASLHKEAPSPESIPPDVSAAVDMVVTATAAIESEEQAKEKVERALAAKEQDTRVSDYIFAIAHMDPRTLGRIAGWVEEIEKKDKYLTPHAITIAEYACGIAAGLNLSPRDIDDIKIAALLHDVGKLGTSAEILQKRDEDLDDAELLTIMRHPMDGAELLQSIPDLALFAPIVLAHHEEYGGNGYPQGLKGEEIPLAARIIFLCNSYHGMTSDVCYGKGISAKDAQKLLKDGAENQYDPALVDVLLKYLQTKAKH